MVIPFVDQLGQDHVTLDRPLVRTAPEDHGLQLVVKIARGDHQCCVVVVLFYWAGCTGQLVGGRIVKDMLVNELG